MVIVNIIGGLGNQMFQYAYAKVLDQKGFDTKINIFEFDNYKLHGGYQLEKYKIDLKVSSQNENNKLYSNSLLSKVFRKIGIDSSRLLKEKSLLFDDSFFNIKDNCYIDGYFQSEKYFKHIRDILLEQFTIKTDISDYTKKMKEYILGSTSSCSVHIRRGDFINTSNLKIHGSCSLEYYKRAIRHLEKNKENMNYFIFSDDIKWCKENLQIENARYIDGKEKRLPHEDIYLMSLCQNNIIANSSFSWWGAWLNQNEEKVVIAPKRWFADEKLESESKDIVCDDWIRV